MRQGIHAVQRVMTDLFFLFLLLGLFLGFLLLFLLLLLRLLRWGAGSDALLLGFTSFLLLLLDALDAWVKAGVGDV